MAKGNMRQFRWWLYDLFAMMAMKVAPKAYTEKEVCSMSDREVKYARGDYFIPDLRKPW